MQIGYRATAVRYRARSFRSGRPSASGVDLSISKRPIRQGERKKRPKTMTRGMMTVAVKADATMPTVLLE